jgi:small-conductance mechanosensitive channel
MELIDFSQLMGMWERAVPLIQAIFIFALLFFISNFFLAVLRRRLLRRATTRKQITTIDLFTKFLRYAVLALLFILAFSIASDSLAQFGLTVGILSAAIGFALQKPITGVAAWIMVMIKRPFEIGDRISIGNVKGNVKDITYTHVYLEEVGRYGGEEISGRTIIIANAKLFEEDIINYSFDHEFVLGQIIFTVTYDSDIDKAMAVALKILKQYTDEYGHKIGREAHIRLQFTQNGMEIHPRYYVPINRAQELATVITKDIFTTLKNHSDVKLSYQQYNINANLLKEHK